MCRTVQEFLQTHWNREAPLLLGYSGGPDSKALLYAILETGFKNLHLAHIDHGWREESAAEADALREEAAHLGLPFHLTRLQKIEGGNQEELAREGRLSFFRSLFEKYPFQALLLAHQADDLAETVLKRVLEGAHLSYLSGMQPISQQGGREVWRPLLSIRRSEIDLFLVERELNPVIDSTNSDPYYLRTRLRQEMIPALERSFGKKVSENLRVLSTRAAELKTYLDRKVAGALCEEGPWGLALEMGGLERIERRHFIQKVAFEEGLSIPRMVLEALLDALEKRCVNGRHQIQSKEIYVDRGALFFLRQNVEPFDRYLDVKVGEWTLGDWNVKIFPSNQPIKTTWHDIWKGIFTVDAPALSFRKYWAELKIPAFLRRGLPLFIRREGELDPCQISFFHAANILKLRTSEKSQTS